MILLLITGLVAHAQTANLNKECFEQNKARSCVRLGTTLWQKPETRVEAQKAFVKGCELKEESACALKDMKVAANAGAAPAATPTPMPSAAPSAPAVVPAPMPTTKAAAPTPAPIPTPSSEPSKGNPPTHGTPALTETPAQAKAPAKTTNSAIKKTGPASYKVSRAAALGYAQDLPTTLAGARMEAKTGAGGVVEGYKFAEVHSGSVFEALGFAKEDIVTHVNGRAVNSPAQATAMLPSLAWLERYEIKLIRGGKPQVFKYQMTE